MQWQIEKGQEDKQLSTNNAKKTKDRGTQTQLGAPEGFVVPVPHVTPVVLLLIDTNII